MRGIVTTYRIAGRQQPWRIAKCPGHYGLDSPHLELETIPALSQDLLDRARIGWERFVASLEETSDG